MPQKFSLIAVILLLGTACSEDPVSREEEDVNPLLGYWRIENTTITESENVVYNLPGSAEPVYMQIVEFQTDIFVVAMNDLADGTYNTLDLSYDHLPENKVNIDGDLFAYSLAGTELILTIDDSTIVGTTTPMRQYTAYTAEFPPQAWLSPLPNDSYEPDDTRDEATAIIVGADAQSHILVTDDEDWFSFVADSGTTYLIDTSMEPATRIMQTYMELYNSSSSAPIDSIFLNLFGETIFEQLYAALTFSPTQTAAYYVKISALPFASDNSILNELKIGPYQIDITEVLPTASHAVNVVRGNPKRLHNYIAWPIPGFFREALPTPGRLRQ